uniref:Uncharacterized protein n=1 Tax=Ditylenchus dipsaci TaxID=166011 RepID=A0A915ELG2_9BILA
MSSRKKSCAGTELDIKLALSEILANSDLLIPNKQENFADESAMESKLKPTVDADQMNATAASSSTAFQEISSIPTFERLLCHTSRNGLMAMRQKFFEDLNLFDRICAKVVRVGVVVLELELVCMIDHFRRCLYFMEGERFTVDYDKTKRVYCAGDYIAVSVCRIDKSLCQLEVALKHEEAILQPNDLPSYYRNFTKSSSYSENTAIAKVKRNPNLCELLRVQIDSEVSGLNCISAAVHTPMESADQLRIQQNRNLAMVHVTRGAELTRQNKCFEAIQCFNKALTVDENCADAYVGRGAACAGSSNFAAALKDLDKALQLEPNHKNAARYTTEVLLAHAKELEKEGNKKEALHKYEKVLELSENNQKAISAIKRLGGSGRDGVEVIDISMEDDEHNHSHTTPMHNNNKVSRNGNSKTQEYGQRRTSYQPTQTPEANKRKLQEMEAFIEKLKRST